jgi:hypothetical protein
MSNKCVWKRVIEIRSIIIILILYVIIALVLRVFRKQNTSIFRIMPVLHSGEQAEKYGHAKFT